MSQVFTQENDTAAPITLAAETIVATTSGVSPPGRGVPVYVNIESNVTSGTGTTALVLRCRRGTLVTSPQVGNSVTQAFPASTSDSVSAGWNDNPGEVAGQQYVITMQQTGGTGNGSVTQSCTQVVVGNP